MQPSSSVYYRTVLTVEIISEAPIPDEWVLQRIAREMHDGDLSGVWGTTSVEELTPAQAAQALIKQGSDPAFFLLDDLGNETDQED